MWFYFFLGVAVTWYFMNYFRKKKEQEELNKEYLKDLKQKCLDRIPDDIDELERYDAQVNADIDAHLIAIFQKRHPEYDDINQLVFPMTHEHGLSEREFWYRVEWLSGMHRENENDKK